MSIIEFVVLSFLWINIVLQQVLWNLCWSQNSLWSWLMWNQAIKIMLIHELDVRFPNHELMSTLSMIYLNLWAKNLYNAKNDFHQCLIVIKRTYYSQWKVGKDGMWVEVLLDSYELDLQCSFCKMNMVINSELVLKEVSNKNSVTWLWVKITSFPILKIKLSKFIKLAKITCV